MGDPRNERADQLHQEVAPSTHRVVDRLDELELEPIVVKGRLTFRFADGDEVYEAGDAYYAPGGHVPVVEAGTEIVEFSPTAEYRRTMEVVAANLAALAPA